MQAGTASSDDRHIGRRVRRQRVLVDEAADERLASSGVATLPLLGPAEVTELTAEYLARAPADDYGLTIDYLRADRGLVRELAMVIEHAVAPRLELVTTEHRIVMSTFVVKHPGNRSEMFLHDDRSYVDERQHRATTVWIPLVDVGPDRANGGLQIVPGSHHLPTGFSGTGTPDLIRPWEKILRGGLVSIRADAGSAVFYDTRVLHASDANYSDSPRIAVIVAIAPNDAPLLHVAATGRRRRRIHRVDADFFLDHHPHQIARSMPPRYPLIEELDEDPTIGPDDLVDLIGHPVDEPPDVVVPLDVAEPDRTISLQSHRRTGWFDVRPSSDLRLTPSEMVIDLPERAVVRPLDERPGVAVFGLVRRWRTRAFVPSALGQWWRAAVGAAARDVDVLALEPGERIDVVSPAMFGWAAELVTIEAPAVGAGVHLGSGAVHLDLGTAVRLPAGRPATLWNDGPGLLVCCASRRPTWTVPAPGESKNPG